MLLKSCLHDTAVETWCILFKTLIGSGITIVVQLTRVNYTFITFSTTTRDN